VWQDAMTLAESCYRLTHQFPRDELFGLTSQIRRAAGSIPANIAEGHGRDNTGNFVQHLRISQGSLKELETHLLLVNVWAFCWKSTCSQRWRNARAWAKWCVL
jgi:four helix bundle protein